MAHIDYDESDIGLKQNNVEQGERRATQHSTGNLHYLSHAISITNVNCSRRKSLYSIAC